MNSLPNLTEKIVDIVDGEPRVSHRLIADSTDNQVKAISQMIGKYKADIEAFGKTPFKMEADSERKLKNPDAKPIKTYYLNEQQATFLMTLLRNNPKVVEFKKALVKAFFKLKGSVENITLKDLLKKELEKIENSPYEWDNENYLLKKYIYALESGGKELQKFVIETLNQKDEHITPNKNIKSLALISNCSIIKDAIKHQESIMQMMKERNLKIGFRGSTQYCLTLKDLYDEYIAFANYHKIDLLNKIDFKYYLLQIDGVDHISYKNRYCFNITHTYL
jgi:phage regulator Rha-like protein